MEKQLKFVGLYQMACLFPGFRGIVNPGDIIKVSDETFEELKGHDDWKPVSLTEKPAQKKETGADEQ